MKKNILTVAVILASVLIGLIVGLSYWPIRNIQDDGCGLGI